MAYTIDFEPLGMRLLCEEPLLLAEAAQRAGVCLRCECGGRSVCGKCLVRVQGAGLPPFTAAEQKLLSGDQLAEGWRLACRAVVSADVRVYVAPESLLEDQVTQTEGLDASLPPDPAVSLLPLQLAAPSLADQASDLGRLAEGLRRQHHVEGLHAGLPMLQALAPALRQNEWRVTAALREKELVGVYPGEMSRPLGLAVDVGSTKLACYLLDLDSGRTLAAKGVMNPQIAYGEDVMSRIESVLSQPGDDARLQAAVVEAINGVAAGLCAAQGRTPEDLLDVCLVGNTAMQHLLLKLPVRALALMPFVAASGSAVDVPGRQVGLHTAPGAHLYMPPSIAAFVGSDHLAFLLATEFGGDQTRLGIDIGTNTEIAVQAGGRILCCSTASGPAFEGAHIRHGMRAAPGAVERVRIAAGGQVDYETVGGKPATGICGSGILDALAEMRRTGIVNKRGRLVEGRPGVRTEDGGCRAFLLASGRDGRRDLLIGQPDIDQVLLAKGAIRAGIEILMARLGLVPDDLEEVLIAGAFGCHLDPDKAMNIGLLPALAQDRVRAVGNAAGTGARMMLASVQARRQAELLAKRIEYVELAAEKDFHRKFALGARL